MTQTTQMPRTMRMTQQARTATGTGRHAAPRPEPVPAVERGVSVFLILAVLAGAGWVASMVWTIVAWATAS
ncbi:morphogenic membrane protein MmpA [Streptomyces sp. GC420]|uniref:morphogenic membrane protein MmpA n=1 Tax=Streptomyces sp. GC420 TaxID=2697568 RepID=UPI001414CE3B|nr:hypothetical protein [Streptomyces sp. GC420]NBM17958.1 hypothetical protein [Streptomyces sp. GC420]